MVDFTMNINRYIIDQFKAIGIKNYKLKSLREDLVNVSILQEKMIRQSPRKVEFSKELEKHLDQNQGLKGMVNYLRLLLTNGTDVNCHQSKEVFNHHTPDPLVHHWKIYHLHLADARTKHRYFKDRTNELLFIYIDDSQALFLNIFNHKPRENFADIKLLEILDNNWPEILTVCNDIVGLSYELNNAERFNMRKHNFNEGIVNVNNKFVFTPNPGVASNGTTISA
ncbi:MAG: hypothetical protein ABI581_14420, partial [Sediminibacterium sp.]